MTIIQHIYAAHHEFDSEPTYVIDKTIAAEDPDSDAAIVAEFPAHVPWDLRRMLADACLDTLRKYGHGDHGRTIAVELFSEAPDGARELLARRTCNTAKKEQTQDRLMTESWSTDLTDRDCRAVFEIREV